MSQTDPAPTEILQSANRCTQAFHRVKAEQPNNAEAAGTAFLAELPILSGPVAFQAWFACLGQALTLGVIDLVDLGRYCHLARMAMSAWKLANPAPKKEKNNHPTPPKGNHSDHEEARKPAQSLLEQSQQPPEAAQNADPYPSKGNHLEEDANRVASRGLPDRKTRNQLYKQLRQRGFPVPSEQSLRRYPEVALHLCDLAKNHLDNLPLIGSHLSYNPAQAS